MNGSAILAEDGNRLVELERDRPLHARVQDGTGMGTASKETDHSCPSNRFCAVQRNVSVEPNVSQTRGGFNPFVVRYACGPRGSGAGEERGAGGEPLRRGGFFRIGGQLVSDSTSLTEYGEEPVAQGDGFYPSHAGIQNITPKGTACEQSDHSRRPRKPVAGSTEVCARNLNIP